MKVLTAAFLLLCSGMIAVTVLAILRTIFHMVGAVFAFEPVPFVIGLVGAVIDVFVIWFLVGIIQDTTSSIKTPKPQEEKDS